MNDDVCNEINTKIRTSTTFAVDTVKVVKVVDVRILVSIPLWTNALCGTWSLLTSLNFKAAYLC